MSKGWAKIATFLVVGYLCMSRSFAYLGIPQLNLFIGEMVLAYFLVFGPFAGRGRWPWVAAYIPSLKQPIKLFSVLFAYGMFQVVRGIFLGNPPLSAVRDLAFNYYPLYLFLGLYCGLRFPDLLPRVIRVLAWFNGTYGVAYVLMLNSVAWTIPGVSKDVVEVPVFGEPFGSAIALLGLLVFESDPWSVWYLLALNLFVLVGMQIRGEWLAFAIGLVLWGWLTKRLTRIVRAGAVVLLFFALLAALDVKIQGPEGRGGGVISARDLVGRALAPVDPALAREYTSNYENATVTTVWRTLWWAEIFTSVHETPVRAVLGFGYGFPLGDLVPYLRGQFIRTPHNFFLYALGYTGWLGVILFCAFQGALLRLLGKAWKEAEESFGLIFWVVCLTMASFTAFFETPYGAIPFYLIIGCAIAPGLCSRRQVEVARLSGVPSRAAGG